MTDRASPAARRARLGTSAIFFLNGFVFATWVVHIPDVRAHLDLSVGVLGLALLAIAIGSIVAMPLAGVAISKVGSRPPTFLLAVLNTLVLPIMLTAPNLGTLVAALLVYGAIVGALDVAMNAQGVAVERLHPKPILSSFHAFWSLGGLLGTAIGSALLGSSLTPFAHGALVAGLFLIVALLAGPTLLPKEADEHRADGEERRDTRSPLSPAVLLLGALGFLGLLGEGAMADWSGVYYRDVLNAEAALTGLGYAFVSGAMLLGRTFGDAWRAKLGDERLVVLGGLVSGVGLLLGLLAASPWLAALGFGAFGLGVANIVPVLFSAAGKVGEAGKAIASVSTLSYLGFLAGPPLIGFVAEIVGLHVGLGIVAVGALVIALLARAALRAAR